jgi:DNA-binding SARP family transcriptional activator
LLDAMARRFDLAATVVTAGAGFGKTTLLAQAVRANLAAPRGVDAWVSCQPGDEDPAELAGAIAASLGATPASGPPLDVAMQALVDAGPVDVCLVIDDVHEVPAGSAASALLADVLRRRPPHVHLLLSSRQPPPVPLARLQAAGKVVEIDEERLALTPVEAEAIAVAAGRPVARVRGLAGWPSLVRLAVSAPAPATGQYLWEEIVDALPDDQRVGLLALATLGCGDAAEIAQVAERPVDIADLVVRVPLVTADDDGRLRIHQLWEDAAARFFPDDDVRRVRRRAVAVLLARRETVRAGWCARRWGEIGMLALAARALVRSTFGALPVETAERWLSGIDDTVDHHLDLRLLRVAARQARQGCDQELDSEIDALAGGYAAGGDPDGEAVALALAAVGAHFRGDLRRVFELAIRVRALPGAGREPVLRFLVGAVDAAVAALQGDVEAALHAIETLPRRGIDARTAELVSRLEVAMLLLAGRADEAADVAEATLAGAASAYVQAIPPIVRWLAGDPTAVRGRSLPTEPDPDTDARDRLYHAAYGTSVFASLGDRGAVAAAWPAIGAVPVDELDARDSAIVAGAIATRRVLEHDEVGAAVALDAHLARHPLSVPAGELHLRRVLAVAHVLSAEVRRTWDAATLGPTHRRARGIAQALLDARRGRVAPEPPARPPVVMTTLPLPWSVELAARAAAAGRSYAPELATELAGWAGAAVRAELDRLRSAGDRALRDGAARLLVVLPETDAPRLRVELLGPVRVLVDGEPVDAPELRRGRVRMLLTLLAVAGPLRRERITDLMWPDNEPSRASRNLRVALSRLRQVLEPERPSGPAGRALRVDGDTVALAGSPRVDVDVWELAGATAEADRAHAAGDATRQAEHLARAVALWRGEPLTDLGPLVDLAPDIEHVRRSLVDAALRLGELRLAAGRTADALRCAERARGAAPYDERAHRLVVAAQMQRRDRAGVLHALQAVEDMLADAGVEPESATAMLIRQARHRTSVHPDAALEPSGAGRPALARPAAGPQEASRRPRHRRDRARVGSS